jgi:hypothetical protein
VTDTEIEITADLVRDLLQEQHPDLAGLALREVAGGWGNQMWRLGDELAVRMQRMDSTPEHQLKERRWLPVLAPRFFDAYAQADEAAIRRARGLAAMKSLFLMLMGQNGDRGLPGGKPNWGPAGRAALDRVLKDVR